MKPVYVPEANPGMAELHMENDLLAHENRLLRARLASYPEAEADATPNNALREPSANDALFRQAFYDIRWFVQRLNGSPFGFFLRRWEGFRVLLDRYGRTSH